MSDNMDMPFDDSIAEQHLESLDGKVIIIDSLTTASQYLERLNNMMNKDKKYEANKYYVGSNSIFARNWGHPTENKAIQHAQKLLETDGNDEIFIVKIVKVVRRKTAPVEVITIK
jgi:hypothetical protein